MADPQESGALGRTSGPDAGTAKLSLHRSGYSESALSVTIPAFAIVPLVILVRNRDVIAFWTSLPHTAQLAIVGFVGILGGALANHVIYTFAYFNPRRISPWGPLPEQAPARALTDRIPVIGWFGLRREGKFHGSGFWVRPLLIEVGTGVGLLMLYRFEVMTGGLLPEQFRGPRFIAGFEPYATQVFFAHLILVVLMIAATFIDFGELTIPDIITIPGTLIAMLLASMTARIYMPTWLPAMPPPLLPRGLLEVDPTTFDSPWFVEPNPWMGSTGLLVGVAIWSVWCFALSDRRWSKMIQRRRGLGRAIRHFINGLFHYGMWKVLAAIWLAGMVAIPLVWSRGGDRWTGMFTALVGLAVGGGVIWAIRIVAALALNKEAMGFGDVTLMAMIGAFLGWQAALLAFFLSPFTAIVIVILRYLVTRDAYTPFGPYLCAGALLSIIFWDRLYNGWLAGHLSLMGPMMLWICIFMLGMMAVLLFVWRLIKESVFVR